MKSLGHTSARINVYSSDLLTREEAELLVDTGSTYSWLSKETLERLGIKPKGVRKFRTIDGRLLERSVGEVVVEYSGERATTMIVFAEKEDAKVLGVHALEGLGLEVDPFTKQLKKSEALLAI